MENRTTFTPSALAATKWPSSWTKMSPPRRRTIEPTLRRMSLAMWSSHPVSAVVLSQTTGGAQGDSRSCPVLAHPPHRLGPAPVGRRDGLIDGGEVLGAVGVEHVGADP